METNDIKFKGLDEMQEKRLDKVQTNNNKEKN